MLRTLIRNIVSNWMGYVVNAVVIFFLTPFVLHSLGDTRYGVWVLATGLTGYFGLLDLGFRAGTTQYLTRHLAQRDYDAVNRTASTSIAALSVCGLTVAVASVLICWLSPFIFTIPEGTVSEVRWCIAVVGISSAFQFVFAPFSAVFAATQRYDVANAMSIPLRLGIAAATYIALRLDCGLLGLCAVHGIGEGLGCLIRARVAHWILPELRISLRQAAWRDFRPILSYGFANSLIRGATTVKTYSSSLIIGLLMPLAALAPFNLAAGLVLQIDRLFAPMAIVFFPVATQLDAQGDRQKLKEMYFKVSRIFLCTAFAITIIGSIWAADFYRLWVGPEYVDGGQGTSVVVLFQILMAASTIQIGQKIGSQVLLGARAMRALTALTVTDALATLVLMVPLILALGLLGVALAALVPALVVRGVLFPIAVCRVVGTEPSNYFRAAYIRPCLVGAILAAPLLLLHHTIPVHGSWALLVLCGCLAATVSAPVLLWVGFDKDERRRLVVEPVRRVWISWNGTKMGDAPL